MSFQEIRLPEDVERGAQGGPGFNTTVITLSSGYEKRNKNWSKIRGKWDISYGITHKTLLQGVIDMFYAVNGMGDGFRFKDWSDFQIGNTTTGDSSTKQAIATGDHLAQTFQVFKKYTKGSATFNRTITKLVSGKFRLFVDSTEKTETTHYTVNYNSGVVTFVATKATKDFTISSITALDGQTVTIGTHVYTFKTTLTASTTADEVLIGTTPTTAALHLFEAINGGAGSGTDYGSNTVAHTTVDALNPSAGVVRATAKTAGTVGNSIALDENCTNAAWAGGAVFLSGGTGAIPGDGEVVNVMAEFDVPVRFKTDDLNVTTEVFDSEAVISIPAIPIYEVRV